MEPSFLSRCEFRIAYRSRPINFGDQSVSRPSTAVASKKRMKLEAAPTVRKPRPAAFDLGPQTIAERFTLMLEETPSRRIKGRLVYEPQDGTAPFIVQTRRSGIRHRRPGELRICEKCGEEYFWSSGACRTQAFCSQRCGKERSRSSKRARVLARGGPKMDRLDQLFSVIVRSVGYCEDCGETWRLQCAHIISRRYHGIRFDFGNAMCLCVRCHMRYTHRPLEWEVFVLDRIGEAKYLDLKHRALAFKGPLDRVAVARTLYEVSAAKGLTTGSAPGWPGWTAFSDSEESA